MPRARPRLNTIARQEQADRTFHVRSALLESLTPERREQLDAWAANGDTTYWERCPLSDLLACLDRARAPHTSDPAKARRDLFEA